MVFVDPDADLKRRLLIVEAERWVIEDDPRTYVFARVDERTAVDRAELSLEGTAGRFMIPGEAVVRAACGLESTCFAAALPPGVPEEIDRLILSVPDLGFETRFALPTVPIGGYSLDARAVDKNRAIAGAIQDPIALRLAFLDQNRAISTGGVRRFPRTFEAVIAPSACGAKPNAAAAWVEVESARFELPAAFSEDAALACLAVRPSAPKGMSAAIQMTVAGRAVVTTFDHIYSPPVEVGPLVFVTLFDLEIPNPGRCTEAQNLILSAVRDAAIGIASRQETPAAVEMIQPEQIAVRDGVLCSQSNDRTFDARALGDRIEAVLDTKFGPDRAVRVLLVYVNNLDLALPPSVLGPLEELGSRFDSPARSLSALVIAPQQVAMAFGTALVVPFSATAEPAFRESISRTLDSGFWPHRTLLHTDNTVVPLINEGDPRVDLFQICSATPAIEPIGLPDRAALRAIDGVPAYTVELPEQILVPASDFERPVVSVRWQACTALCDRPAPSAPSGSSWLRDGGCL